MQYRLTLTTTNSMLDYQFETNDLETAHKQFCLTSKTIFTIPDNWTLVLRDTVANQNRYKLEKSF